MADKAASETLVASLRQRRKLKQDALQASFRTKSPPAVNKYDDDDDNEEERDNSKKLGAASETSVIDEGSGGGAELPTLRDNDDGNKVDSLMAASKSTAAPTATRQAVVDDPQRTVRERMRQRMMARRERPTTSTDDGGEASERLEGSKSQTSMSTSRRLRGLREAKTLLSRTRFDGAESKDDDDLEQELAARTLLREKWKRALSSAEDPSAAKAFGPTDEESHDFFMGLWKADDEEDEQKIKEEEEKKQPTTTTDDTIQEENEGGVVEEEQPGEEENKKLLSDFFFDDDEPLDYVRFVEAEYARRWEREAILSRPLYVPGSATLMAEDKLGVGGSGGVEENADVAENDETLRQKRRQPRDWESEGFHVGAPPYVTLSNRNKMESRLLTEKTNHLRRRSGGGGNWFRADGRLDAAPLPLKTVATRPPLEVEALPEDAETFFVDPLVATSTSMNIFGDGDGDEERGARNLLQRHQRHLHVELRNLSFVHHHLFSEEHVLATRLEQSYDRYVEYLKKDVVGLKNMKIETLRRSVETIKDKLKTLVDVVAQPASESASEIQATIGQLETRLGAQRSELKQSVQLRNIEMKNAKTLTANILLRWKALKVARETRGSALTLGKLSIYKEDADEEKDKDWWEREVAAAVALMRDEFNEARGKTLKAYERDLESWRRGRKAMKEAEKKKKRLRKAKKMKELGKENDVGEDEDDIMTEEDESLATDLEAPKPSKPPLFEEEAAIAAAIETGRAHWRKPGEPKIRFKWTKTGGGGGNNEPPQPTVPTAEAVIAPLEMRRREAIGKIKIHARVLYNGKEVKTLTKTLTNEFVINFNAAFQLEVSRSSVGDLKLEIYESSSFASSTLVAEVFAPLPDSSGVIEETLQFSSSRVIVAGKDGGVGSGVPIERTTESTLAGEEKHQSPLTSGKICVNLRWMPPRDGALLSLHPAASSSRRTNAALTLMKRGDVLGAVGLAGISDKTRLKQWILQDSSMDPNDPKNAELVRLVEECHEYDDDFDTDDCGARKYGEIDGGYKRDDEKKRYFRLDHSQREFDFCTEEELNSDPRFRLLEMRSRKISEFRNLKMIPAFAAEIPAAIFAAYEQRIKDEQAVDAEEDDDDVGREADVDAKRRRMIRFLQKIRKQVADRFAQVSKYKTVKDVVVEEEIPNVSTLAASILSLQVRFARPLHPVRVARKANVQGSTPGAPGGIGPEVRVYVNILRAFNLPIRESSTTLASAMSPDRAPTGYGSANPFVVSAAAARFQRTGGGGVGFSPNSFPDGGGHSDADILDEEAPVLKPFVEVMFQRRTARTSTAEGANASWNEEVLLPFQPPNDDFSPTTLQKVVDVIHVTLFDEVVTDITSESTEEDTSTTKTIHKRVVNKWLGSIKIPFTTLFFNGKIEGTFRVRMPSVLLGYRKSKEGFINDQFRSSGNHSYLHFYLTLDPPLNAADPIRERFDSNESEQLLRKTDEFVNNYLNRFPDRTEVTTTVINLQGKSVFVTRFVRPITPPTELMGGGGGGGALASPWQQQQQTSSSTFSSAARVARFVACIPNVSDSAFFAGMCDLWSTCDQFLQMMTGDEEEHALLLLNFFLAMGKSAWLVLGIAIPEGPTAYVLTKDNPSSTSGAGGGDDDTWLWNPSSGVRYSVKDSFCPVTAIHSLLDSSNIWLNVQTHVTPAQMNFDVAVARDWMPFFGGKFLNPGLSSVQPEALHYAAIDETYVRSLTEKLERSVRENLMRWRPKQITRWNRLCSQALEKILPRLEDAAASGSASGVGGANNAAAARVDHAAMMDPLTPFLSSYALTGFPLHSTFTDNAAILDAVFATGIHNNNAADVEFALGVYIHAYPAHVLSVWVYVASLEKKT